jgi:predicted  nucleic acid-binding Zn-ribbon protein
LTHEQLTGTARSATDAPTALEDELAELRRALDASHGREVDFRQAAFDLNAELLRMEDEIESLKERLASAEALRADVEELRKRTADYERIMRTRGVRAVVRWWSLKASLRRRA